MKTEDIKTWDEALDAHISDGQVVTTLDIQEAMQAEIDELRAALADRDAKLAALEKQEPIAWLVYGKGSHRYSTLTFDVSQVPDIFVGGDVVALYAAVGAAPPKVLMNQIINDKVELQHKLDDALAKLAALEKQEPVAWMNNKRDMTYFGHYNKDDLPLFAAAGAAPKEQS